MELVVVLLLSPVNISGLRGESAISEYKILDKYHISHWPANIHGDKDDAGAHDDKQGLQGDVMLDCGDGEALAKKENYNILNWRAFK